MVLSKKKVFAPSRGPVLISQKYPELYKCQGHDSEPRGHDNVPVAGLAVACRFKITRRVNLCHSKLQGLQAGLQAVCSCR